MIYLSWNFPPPERVKSQYASTTCGPNAIAAITELYFEKLNGYYTKFSEGSISAFQLIPEWLPEGMAAHEVGEVMIKHGITEHHLLPEDYDHPKIMDYVTDKEALLQNAEKYKFKAFRHIETLDEIREALKICPVLIGTAIFNSFFSLNNYNYRITDQNGFAGFHFMAILDDCPEENALWVLNSHGPKWAKNGVGLMPYDYFPKFPLTKIVAFTPYKEVEHLKIKEQLLFRNRPYTKLNSEGLVMHSTDNPGATAQNHYVYFNTGERNSSAHYFADWIETIRLIPENEQAWHGGPTANKKYMSYEMCEPSNNDPDRFNKFKKVWDDAVEFAADYCKRNNFTEKDILNHNIISQRYPNETNHTDPIGFFKRYGKTWANFISEVKSKLQGGKDQMKVAIVFWSWDDASGVKQIADRLGSCGMFCRNRKASNIHLDAMGAIQLINVGGPEITNHQNVTNLCGLSGPDTAILAANYAKKL